MVANPAHLNSEESAVVLALVGLIAWEVIQSYRSRLWLSVYRPTLIVAVILVWYALVSPLQMVFQTGAAISRGLNHRDLLIHGWTGALMFYAFLLIGFYAFNRVSFPRRLINLPRLDHLYRLGLRLCQTGLLMFAVVTGLGFISLLNPLGSFQAFTGSSGFDLGAFTNYFNLAINLLIPGVCLIFASWLRTRRHTASLLFWLVAALGIYTSLGFRFRYVLLLIPILLLSFFVARRRPPLLIIVLFLVSFVAINSVIGFTRSYGVGLDLSRLETATAERLSGDAALGEGGVFLATSGIISQTPKRYPFVGLQPFVSTLLFPVPRALFPSKPEAEYVLDANLALYGRIHSPGAAFLNYAEYYLIAGWPSLIAMSTALGWLLRRLWNWFLWRQDEPFAQVIYLLSVCYLYMVISRGYLPQVVTLFVFTVAPLYWLYGRWAQPVARLDAPPSLPRG